MTSMTQTLKDLVLKLEQMIPGMTLDLPDPLLEQTVSWITSDSRKVRPGTVFVAFRGETQDGHDYIEKAIESGAMLILGERSPQEVTPQKNYYQVPDGRLVLSHLASQFYGNPSHSMQMVGVTGTSGKTTTTYLIESILKNAGHQVGVIGTVNFRYGSIVIPSTHTTPGPVEIQELLARMKAEGCTAVVMEVSSHALKQKRVASIAFDGTVFTNLSPEHLDYHPDMEDYFQSKVLLFTELAEYSRRAGKNPVAAVPMEDPYGQRLLKILESQAQKVPRVIPYSVSRNFKMTLNGINGTIEGVQVHSKMTGQFNCANIAAAVSVTFGLRIPASEISEGVQKLEGVPGRLERVENSRGIHIWVDYAHKPDALEKVIKTLREIREGHSLITVFGCGGDRDRKKRSIMGRIAVEWSDSVWITSDNPRTEDPLEIIKEILAGTEGFHNFRVEADRRKAIFGAIQEARPGDLILIAGKGHEDYQILGTEKIHFDDREVAREAATLK